MRTPVLLIVLATTALVIPTRARAKDSLPPTLQDLDDREGADVIGAFKDSLRLPLIEHGSRIGFQTKTRRELGGNFWHDYRRSVRIPGQWQDTDAWWVNYSPWHRPDRPLSWR